MNSSHSSLIKLLLALTLFASATTFAQEPSPVTAPSSVSAVSAGDSSRAIPGTSDSGQLEDRMVFRVRRALEQKSDKAGAAALGAPGGYNWIVLMQVSRYSDSNVRLTNMRRGVQRFLDALAAARRGRPAAQVRDTITVLPYHFNLLNASANSVRPLRDFLDSEQELKKLVPGDPQDDRYQNQLWRDGHDWRAALQQTVGWMAKNDLDPSHTIIVVLDWNNLSQAPATLANGAKPATPATDSDLVLPTNQAKFAAYSETLRNAGFAPNQNLETVQVGRLEYDMAVFTPRDLTALPVSTETVNPTPIPTSDGIGGGGGGGGSLAWIVPIILLLGGIGIVFFLTRPIAFKLDEIETRSVTVLPTKTLPLLGSRTEPKGVHYRVPGVTLDTERPLATISAALPNKIIVTSGALNVQNSEGFDQTPNGLKLRGRRGEFDLVDSSTGRVITSVSLRL